MYDYEERRLLTGWLVHGHRGARDKLYLRLLPLARRTARRYEWAGEPPEDLVQVASIGALKAIDRFDLERPISLQTYAAPMIDGELRHHLRDSSALLHLPRALYATARAVSGAAGRLAARLGRGPTPEEIGRELGLTTEEVVDARAAEAALRPQSLEALSGWARDDRSRRAERLGRDDPRYELIERRLAIERAWRSLAPRERQCLQLRFVEDLTYIEIAARVGLSVSHAARLTTRALERLQAVAAAGG